jgi:hypothetical protein
MTNYKFSAQYIASEWRDGRDGTAIVDIDPYTSEVIDTFPAASLEDVDAAYRAAEAAQRNWANTTPSERAEIFRKTADILERRQTGADGRGRQVADRIPGSEQDSWDASTSSRGSQVGPPLRVAGWPRRARPSSLKEIHIRILLIGLCRRRSTDNPCAATPLTPRSRGPDLPRRRIVDNLVYVELFGSHWFAETAASILSRTCCKIQALG